MKREMLKPIYQCQICSYASESIHYQHYKRKHGISKKEADHVFGKPEMIVSALPKPTVRGNAVMKTTAPQSMPTRSGKRVYRKGKVKKK